MKIKFYRNLKAPKGKVRAFFVNKSTKTHYLLGDFKHRRSALRAIKREWPNIEYEGYIYDDKGGTIAHFIMNINGANMIENAEKNGRKTASASHAEGPRWGEVPNDSSEARRRRVTPFYNTRDRNHFDSFDQ